jgi:hypothetical protein
MYAYILKIIRKVVEVGESGVNSRAEASCYVPALRAENSPPFNSCEIIGSTVSSDKKKTLMQRNLIT